jgi:hypothetical protein
MSGQIDTPASVPPGKEVGWIPESVLDYMMLHEYPQEFITSILKPSRSRHHSSETIYQGTIFITRVNGISEKFEGTGNGFNVRTIFKTK